MGLYPRIASATALAASLSMAATPLAAAEMPPVTTPVSVATAGVFDSDGANAQAHRRWRGRNRVDAGDVIAGVLVIGAIAAIAGSVSKSNRDRDYRNGDYRYPQRYPGPDRDPRYDYRGRPGDTRIDDSRGLDRAVDMCAREVERNARIDTVDSANRTASGWDVSGRLRTGEPFHCSIGNDGRIDGVDYGRGSGYRGDASGTPADGQWSDDRYAAARAAQDGTPDYPGGPLPDVDDPADDGRYQTAQAPDFQG